MITTNSSSAEVLSSVSSESEHCKKILLRNDEVAGKKVLKIRATKLCSEFLIGWNMVHKYRESVMLNKCRSFCIINLCGLGYW